MYRLPDIVGDSQARPTWIAASGGLYGPPLEIWVGTNGYGVVVVQPETGNIKRYTTADGLPSNMIRDVEAEDCEKGCDFRDIWIATDAGVGHWDDTRWTAYTVADGLPSNDVRGVAPGGRNVVWAATARGAAYFDGQTWQAFTRANGPPVEDLQGVIGGRDSAWFSTLGQGLVIFQFRSP
jgi:ligand-binding sensor domain-containing protein